MGKDNSSFIGGIFLGFAIMFIIAIIMQVLTNAGQVPPDKLGSAICEMEYNKTFQSYDYNTNTLVCKARQVSYDGLAVQLGASD